MLCLPYLGLYCYIFVKIYSYITVSFYLFLGGQYGMSFSSPDGGFPAPYGDGYGMHMVLFLYNWTSFGVL